MKIKLICPMELNGAPSAYLTNGGSVYKFEHPLVGGAVYDIEQIYVFDAERQGFRRDIPVTVTVKIDGGR